MCAPLLGEIHIDQYLATGKIEQVIAGGENYDGSRPCDFDWVKKLRKNARHTILPSALSKPDQLH